MDIRRLFFKYRSYTPIPLILLALYLAKSTVISFFSGLVLICLGEGLRFWGVLYAGSATRTTGEAGACRLVTDGPFALMRNPLYTGNFFLGLGMTVMGWAWMPWMAVVFLIFFWIQYSQIVALEEEFLLKRFGDLYEHYRQNVPRWFFCTRPYVSKEQSDPRFLKALKSERNTFQAIASIVILILIRWHFR